MVLALDQFASPLCAVEDEAVGDEMQSLSSSDRFESNKVSYSVGE